MNHHQKPALGLTAPVTIWRQAVGAGAAHHTLDRETAGGDAIDLGSPPEYNQRFALR